MLGTLDPVYEDRVKALRLPYSGMHCEPLSFNPDTVCHDAV